MKFIQTTLVFPVLIAMISKLAPGGGKGETVIVHGTVVGYAKDWTKIHRR